MRNSALDFKRLPHLGKKINGGYLCNGDLVKNFPILPENPPVIKQQLPGPRLNVLGLSNDKNPQFRKLLYKNVSPGNRAVWPRRKLLRTASRPRRHLRLTTTADMLQHQPALTANPIFSHGYQGRASFRFWIFFWYWGLDKKWAKNAKLAYSFVKPRGLSFSKWPRLWIGSRSEHRYITQKAGKMYFIYHMDVPSMMDVLSVICYTIALGRLQLQFQIMPTIWVNTVLLNEATILEMISSCLLIKLGRLSDWPPLTEFELDWKLWENSMIVKRYHNRTSVDYYDNIIVCAYPNSIEGMNFAKHSWAAFAKHLAIVEKKEKRSDKKLLAIPSTIPVKKITVPETEVISPRKKLFPNYFIGHGASATILDNLKKTKPWAVQGDDIILIYKRFKKQDSRESLRKLEPSYYSGGLQEARRTDIRGMRYDIRMLEYFNLSESRLLASNLNWAPMRNIIALGSWQALPAGFAQKYWLGFTRILSPNNYVSMLELHGIIANTTQVYSRHSMRFGISYWPWECLVLKRKDTWGIWSNQHQSSNYTKFCLLDNQPISSSYKEYPILVKYNNKLSYLGKLNFPNNRPWLIFYDLPKVYTGLAYTMLGYFFYNLRDSTSTFNIWHNTGRQVTCTFFKKAAWSDDGLFKNWKKIQHNWQPVSCKQLMLQFNKNNWNSYKSSQSFHNNYNALVYKHSRLLYKTVTIQSTLRLQFFKKSNTRINSDLINVQSCNVWTHLQSMPFNYPSTLPIKTILANWTTLLPQEAKCSAFATKHLLPVEAGSAVILREWLQMRPSITYGRQLGFRLLKLNSIGMPYYNIGKLRILYTRPGIKSDWKSGWAAWPKWLGYGRGWTGHIKGDYLLPENRSNGMGFNKLALNPIKFVLNKLKISDIDNLQMFEDSGYWIYIFFRAPLGTWQALAVASVLLADLRINDSVASLVQVWHGGLLLPADFFQQSSWDNSGRYKWPERLILIWNRASIAWVERKVRGRRRYNRKYTKLASELRARSLFTQCIRIRFPSSEEGFNYYSWARKHFVYSYSKTARSLSLLRAEFELSIRWAQLLKNTPLSGDDE